MRKKEGATVKIALCDDDKSCLERVKEAAAAYAKARPDASLAFFPFSDPGEVLRQTKEQGPFDIYVLDVVMPGTDGIALGTALRAAGVDGKIIYLTSSREYALDSYRVRAFQYLLKPIETEAFFAVMDDAIRELSERKSRGIMVKTKSGSLRIPLDSVLYAELSRRAVKYHLTDGRTVETTTLRVPFPEAVGELLTDRRFVLCGASMAANLHHVTAVKSEGVVFRSGASVFLGKKACRELRTAWNTYWIHGEGGGE